MAYFDEDITPSDYLEAASHQEKIELANMLKEDGYLDDLMKEPVMGLGDTEFTQALDRLRANRLQLTVEEEEYIKKISSRFFVY